MRLIKMLGLAAIVGVAAMAFLSAAPASASQATLLCSNNTATLAPTAVECGPVKKIHFVSVPGPEESNHGLLLGAFSPKCNVLLSAETPHLLVAAGARLNFATNVKLEYPGCLNGFHVLVIQQGHILVLKTALGLAEVTASGFEVNVLGNGLNCDYDATGLVGHGLDMGDGLSHVTYSGSNVNLIAKLAGFFPCPTTGALHLLLRSLTPLYIRS